MKKIKQNYAKLAKSQKKGSGTPAYTRYINRWLGRILASILACINISPNFVSIISSVITISSLLLFLILPNITFLHSFILVMLLYFAYAMDSADGQLARLLNKQSKIGEWLDHSLDAIKIPLMHGVAIILIIENKMPGKLMIIFYLTVLSLASANFLSGILKTKLIKKHITENNYKEEKSSTIRSILTLPLDYGVFVLLFLFTFKSDWFMLLYNIWGIVFIVYSVLLFVKSWRELAKDA